MKMPNLAAQIIAASFGFAVIACSQTPEYRRTSTSTPGAGGYYLPWCEDFETYVGTQRAPCRPPVVSEPEDVCVKRFGKICHGTQGDNR